VTASPERLDAAFTGVTAVRINTLAALTAVIPAQAGIQSYPDATGRRPSPA
jgi:hypothetical protein